VRILDFGIVKAKQRLSQTVSGTVKGNLEYMSPEQARGKEVDPRSDLFSAGLVIFHAASGEPFYTGETFYELLTSAAIGPTPEKRDRIAKLAPPLPAILSRALEHEPADRFQTAAEFKLAISTHVKNGAQEALAARIAAMFGDELRAEQDRLANAFPRTPYPEPFETSHRS
jgi:serine/threonine protein kinase